MEGFVLIIMLSGVVGAAGGFLVSGVWEAFCLIASRTEPTSNQVAGLVLGGSCTALVIALGLGLVLLVMEGF